MDITLCILKQCMVEVFWIPRVTRKLPEYVKYGWL